MKKYVWLMCLGLLLACGREETKADVSGSPVVAQKTYSQYALFLIRRWLALPYHLYCLRLAALYEK